MPKRVRPNSQQSTRSPNGSKKGSKSKQGGQKPKKGSSKRSRPSQYRQFDQGTAFLRDHVVRGFANQLIGHRKENGGAVQRGFLKGLIDSANDVNSQLEITRNDINLFVFDETGDNTHGKDDRNNRGKRVVVPAGVIPKQLVNIKNSHFTVVPVSNLRDELVFVTIIFKGEKLLPVWSMGVDIFAEWVIADDYL